MEKSNNNHNNKGFMSSTHKKYYTAVLEAKERYIAEGKAQEAFSYAHHRIHPCGLFVEPVRAWLKTKTSKYLYAYGDIPGMVGGRENVLKLFDDLLEKFK